MEDQNKKVSLGICSSAVCLGDILLINREPERRRRLGSPSPLPSGTCAWKILHSVISCILSKDFRLDVVARSRNHFHAKTSTCYTFLYANKVQKASEIYQITQPPHESHFFADEETSIPKGTPWSFEKQIYLLSTI